MTFADQLNRCRQAVDDAMAHHQNAADAFDRADRRAVALEHAHVTRCLRSAQGAFRDMATAAAEEGSDATKTIQTSDGTDVSGGSENARGSPLLKGNAGVKDWLDRARVGARR